MTPLSSFSLRGGPETQEGPAGLLLQEGRETGLYVQAASLEAQFHVPPGLFLLFFTDNSPYEEQLQILLLDSHFQLLDGLTLGQSYTPGLLSQLEPQGEQQLRFCFFADIHLLLSVHPEGMFQISRHLPSFAKALKGRFLSRYYLNIQVTAGSTGQEYHNAK